MIIVWERVWGKEASLIGLFHAGDVSERFVS
jgi:hypothetical protein